MSGETSIEREYLGVFSFFNKQAVGNREEIGNLDSSYKVCLMRSGGIKSKMIVREDLVGQEWRWEPEVVLRV